jgi:hypothetical protein
MTTPGIRLISRVESQMFTLPLLSQSLELITTLEIRHDSRLQLFRQGSVPRSGHTLVVRHAFINLTGSVLPVWGYTVHGGTILARAKAVHGEFFSVAESTLKFFEELNPQVTGSTCPARMVRS